MKCGGLVSVVTMTDDSAQKPLGEAREHLISTQCRACGAPIFPAGTGRRPRYCSSACRQRAWALRQAAEQLDRPDPQPTVVREVVERTVEVQRAAPAPPRPRTVEDWVPLLEQLEQQVRENPRSLVRGPEDFQNLAAAVRQLHNAFSWHTPESSTSAPSPSSSTASAQGHNPSGLSRQQRRALERQQRKRR